MKVRPEIQGKVFCREEKILIKKKKIRITENVNSFNVSAFTETTSVTGSPKSRTPVRDKVNAIFPWWYDYNFP